ncbi:MAG: DUF2344 domain-containing protein [Clostridia bacterium]|nr:DUF2344 domain-containing protein [Clostridia bacterium]
MKMLVVFEKFPRIRHIGHLDLMRAMQRALRRSGLPVKFSQGFNPHLLLTFAAPLSVGMAGKREIMEVPLAADVAEEDFLKKLNAALPPELPCLSARIVDDKHPASMASLYAAKYEILIDNNGAAICNAIPAFLAQESIMALRKTKSGEKMVDIRPMIFDIEVQGDNKLCCTLALSEAATCKPDLLMEALCSHAGLESRPRTTITRLQMFGKDLVPLELV